MVVIADTSPLNYLILIDEVRVLPALYGQVTIPPAVLAELRVSGAPRLVAAWAEGPPSWIRVRAPAGPIDPLLKEFGAGEREAIMLAEEQSENVLLLLDDDEGRQEAARRHLRAIGTIGLLRDAADIGLLHLSDAFTRLQETTFRASPALYAVVLEQQVLRRSKSQSK